MNKKIIIFGLMFLIVFSMSVESAEAGWFGDLVDWFMEQFGFGEEEAQKLARELTTNYSINDLYIEKVFTERKVIDGITWLYYVSVLHPSDYPYLIPDEKGDLIKRSEYEGSLKDIYWNGEPLFGCDVISDETNLMECLDFSEHSRIYRFSSPLNSVPLRKYKLIENATTKKIEKVYDKSFERTLNFIDDKEQKELTLEVDIDEIVEWGPKSSVGIITTNATYPDYNDTNFDSAYQDRNHGIVQIHYIHVNYNNVRILNTTSAFGSAAELLQFNILPYVSDAIGQAGYSNLFLCGELWNEGPANNQDGFYSSWDQVNASDTSDTFEGCNRSVGSYVGSSPYYDTAPQRYNISLSNITALQWQHENNGYINILEIGYGSVNVNPATRDKTGDEPIIEVNWRIPNDPPYFTKEPEINSTLGTNLTTEDLWCRFTPADLDTDTVTAEIKWLKDNVTQFTFNNLATTLDVENSFDLTSDNTTKGDLWNCEIRLYDPISFYSSWINSTQLIINSNPTNPTLLLNSTTTDQQNYTNETLACNFPCSDPDSADTLTHDISWYKNGIADIQFTSLSCANPSYNSPTLTSDNTTVNDLWACSINVTDNYGQSSSTVFSNNVTIKNYPPSAINILFNSTTSTQTNYTNETLQLTFTFTEDLDLDNGTWIVAFSKNNVEQFMLEGSATNNKQVVVNLDSGNTTSYEEVWDGKINVTDSEGDSSVNYISNNITIKNYYPYNIQITDPSPSNNTQTPNHTITFNCSAEDIDKEVLDYQYMSDTGNTPTVIIGNETTEYNHTYTADGLYWWKCRAVDIYARYTDYSEGRYLVIDNSTVKNYTLDYETSTSEGTVERFEINISYNPIQLDYIDAKLVYQNIHYDLTQENLTDALTNFFIDLEIPIVSANPTLAEFYFNITDFYNNGSISYEKTANSTQSVNQIRIDNCSIYNYPVLQLSVFDEENPTNPINATFEAEILIWSGDQRINSTFYNSLNNSHTYTLCLLNESQTIFTNIYIKYTTLGSYSEENITFIGFTHRYYLNNETLKGSIQSNYSSYNFITTTGISDLKLTLRNLQTYNYFGNIISQLQRRYPAEGVWRTVQMDKSGDYGLIFFNIKEENTDYRMIFADLNNNILRTTDSMKFICTSGICELTVLLNEYAAGTISPDLILTPPTYDNLTGNISLSWNDPLGKTSSLRLHVIKETMTGTVSVCDTTKSGSSGSITCDVSSYQGEVLARVYSSASPELPVFTTWIPLTYGVKLSNFIGDYEGALWSFGIILTIVASGLFSPAGAVIAAVIGLIIILFLGLFSAITLTFIIIACVMGTLIGLKVRN